MTPAHGFVTQVADSQGHVWWSDPVYDIRGRVTQFTNGNGEVTHHTYDDERQTLATVRARFNTTAFHHMSFQFDGLGNLTRRQDHRHNRFETFRYAEPAKSRRIPRLRKEGTGRSPSQVSHTNEDRRPIFRFPRASRVRGNHA